MCARKNIFIVCLAWLGCVCLFSLKEANVNFVLILAACQPNLLLKLEPKKKKMKMTKYLDIKRFISDVQQRPALWNRNYVVNKAFTEDTWDELADLHHLSSKFIVFWLVFPLKSTTFKIDFDS